MKPISNKKIDEISQNHVLQMLHVHGADGILKSVNEGLMERAIAEAQLEADNDYFRALVQDMTNPVVFDMNPKVDEIARFTGWTDCQAAILSQLDSPTTEFVRVPSVDDLLPTIRAAGHEDEFGPREIAEAVINYMKGE